MMQTILGRVVVAICVLLALRLLFENGNPKTLLLDWFRLDGIVPFPVLLAALAGCASFLIPLSLSLWTGRAKLQPSAALSIPYVALSVANLLLRFLFAAVEEVLFRGTLLRIAARRISLPAAVILSALLFAVSHWSGAWPPDYFGTASLFLEGVCFGIAYLATGSLWLGATWHASRNVMVWLTGGGSYRLVAALATLRYVQNDIWIDIFDISTAVLLTAVTWLLLRSRLRCRTAKSAGAASI